FAAAVMPHVVSTKGPASTLTLDANVDTLYRMTDAAKVDYRQERGAMLAKSRAKAFKHIAGDTYLVPSATATGSGSGYVVDIAAGKCTCPDYEERGLPCKHQWAVRY